MTSDFFVLFRLKFPEQSTMLQVNEEMAGQEHCYKVVLPLTLPAQSKMHEFPEFAPAGFENINFTYFRRVSRVSMLRDLFQRGKPIPIEELDSESDDKRTSCSSESISV